MQKKLTEKPIPIIGAWKLVSFQSHKDNQVSYPFGEDAQGSIVYTESGRFSVQVMRTNRPRFKSGDHMNGTVEEILGAFYGCISYYGSYEFDDEGGVVLHHVEGSLFPNWEGQTLKRYSEVSGHRLKLTTVPTWWDGGEVVGMLEWEHICATQ